MSSDVPSTSLAAPLLAGERPAKEQCAQLAAGQTKWAPAHPAGRRARGHGTPALPWRDRMGCTGQPIGSPGLDSGKAEAFAVSGVGRLRQDWPIGCRTGAEQRPPAHSQAIWDLTFWRGRRAGSQGGLVISITTKTGFAGARAEINLERDLGWLTFTRELSVMFTT